MENRLLKLELDMKEVQVERRHSDVDFKKIANNIEQLCSDVKKIANHQDRIEDCERDLKTLKPIIAIVEYPKIALLACIGLYMFTIKEVRDHLLVFFKFF